MTINTPISKSYEKVSPFFRLISKQYESDARERSFELAHLRDGDALLVVSPPTDYFIETLVRSNPKGENHLVAFSENLRRRAEKLRRRIAETSSEQPDCAVEAATFDRLPFDDDHFDVVFAYCYLDFLGDPEGKAAAKEILRVLKPAGRLLTTYLAPPQNIIQRLIVPLITSFSLLSGGLRVVEPEPTLKQIGFKKIELHYLPQKGLPVVLAYAEK